MSDFDSMLWRPIEPGTEFDHLLPKTSCKPTYVGEGLTDFSIDAMEDNILEYEWQTEKLAGVLQKQTLNKTAEAVHEFLYKHIQYHADKNDQLLRSPACSWYTRKEGIDCKSYSIFASCLLLNMGITHYIRKIKQPSYEPEEFTHVYVIVPIDQTNGSLNKGYYVIDGTIRQQEEPAFVGYKDLKMAGMKHYSLNGQANSGLNGGISLQELKDLSKKFSFKDIGSLFKGLDCLGGSSMNGAGAKEYLANVDKYYQNWNLEFNQAIQADNTQLTSYLVAKFRGMTTVFEAASVRNRNKTNWNSCTNSGIDRATDTFRFYRDVVGALLSAYMDEYFNKVSGTFPQSTDFTSENAETLYGFRHLNVSPPATNTQPKQMYNPRLDVSIPAFTLPQYVLDQTNAGQPINLNTALTAIEALGGLVRVVSLSSGGSNSGTNTSGGTKPIFDGNGNISVKPIGGTTKQAGIGTVVVIGGVLYGLSRIFSSMKDTGPGAKTTTKTTSKAK